MVRVLYFAACRERTGLSDEAVDLGGRSVEEAVAALARRHPALEPVLPRCRVAVNAAFALSTDVVPDGAELALIPPVAGG
jgi:molybdopterin synthase catalytic subunit